jgi:hypothetical protein
MAMGKLLIGKYGQPPDAESVTISLRDCHQRLGLKPSDFVSSEDPNFFHRRVKGALGRYLVFQLEASEIQDAAVWRPGFYLLPLDAADVLNAFSKQEVARASKGSARPYELESKQPLPDDVLARAQQWAERSQPLLFKCHCAKLVLKMEGPTFLRRYWKARLTCRKRCQPALKSRI